MATYTDFWNAVLGESRTARSYRHVLAIRNLFLRRLCYNLFMDTYTIYQDLFDRAKKIDLDEIIDDEQFGAWSAACDTNRPYASVRSVSLSRKTVGTLAMATVMYATLDWQKLCFVALLVDRGVQLDGNFVDGQCEFRDYIARSIRVHGIMALPRSVNAILGVPFANERDGAQQRSCRVHLYARRWRDAPLILLPDKRWRKFFARDGDGAIWSIICSLF